jgi:WD40 repeat protein
MDAQESYALTFSDDGALLVSREADVLRLWATGTGELQRVIPIHSLNGLAPQSVPGSDGRSRAVIGFIDRTDPDCAYYGLGCRIILFSESGDVVQVQSTGSAFVRGFRLNADRRIIAYFDSEHIWIQDTLTGENLAVLDSHSIMDLAFSPDGKALVSVGNDGDIRLWGVSQPE